jgi:hypothetical protein
MFAAPVAAAGLLAAWHNDARFGEPWEFGHRYLAVKQRVDIDAFGLFDVRYLTRNVEAALVRLPDLSLQPPWIAFDGNGIAIWATTPPLLWLLTGARPGALARTLWLTAGSVAVWTLLYQNTGWFQFGYRFSLDYMVFLVLLLALGGRPFTAGFKALVVAAIAVNAFGAITFGRFPQFYR